jgi:hypothetical protein
MDDRQLSNITKLKKKKKTLGGISIFVGVNLTPLPFFIH